MSITIPQIKEQFNIWNKKIFNNELPVPNFELMQTKSLLGQYRRRKVMGETVHIIRISIYYDRPMDSYINTIVHEMLHYYIRYKGIKDTSSHGREWKRMAAQISDKFNLTIERTSAVGGGVSKTIIEKKANKNVGKFEYVFVCKMRDGHFGAGVCSLEKVNKLKPLFEGWMAVKEFKVVKAPWNQTYSLRHLRKCAGVNYITENSYNDLLKNKILKY